MPQVQTDGKGQPYVNVGNLRVTVVEKDDWAGFGKYLRIQAYRDSARATLHRPAEFPIFDPPNDVPQLVAAILSLTLK